MNKFKNCQLSIILLYCIVSIVIFISQAHARDDAHEPTSLFTPTDTQASLHLDISTHFRQQNIVINPAFLKTESEANERIHIEFLDQSIIAKRTKFLSGIRGSVTWIGKPEGRDGTIVLAACGNTLFGRIEIGNEAYQIEPVPNTANHRIFKIDPDFAAPIDTGSLIPPPDTFYDRTYRDSDGSIKKDDGSVIDVLVLYTDGFATTYTDDTLVSKISYLASVANTAYTNSEINLTVRVVGLEQVNYKDGGSLSDALNDLTYGTGVFSKISSLRSRLGADLVVLMRVYSIDNDACGLAWQMTSLSSAFEKYAFSVVQVGSSGRYYCTDQTLAHEMGHNMGCDHEAAYATKGLFNYSYGYCFSPYKSVMAYCTNSETTVSYFSNPDVSYNGLVTGADDANNAKSINKAKLTVSQFQDSKCLGSIEVSGSKLILNREGSAEITVTITGEYDAPAESETIETKVDASGKKLISVLPSSSTTNADGQVSFVITAGKKAGKTRITFKAGCLKKSVSVKIQ